MMKKLQQILRPRVVIPVLLSVAVLADLLLFGNVGQVIHLMEAFNRLYLLWFVVLMAVYEVVRGIQLHDQFRAAPQARQSSGSSRRPQVPKEASQATDRV